MAIGCDEKSTATQRRPDFGTGFALTFTLGLALATSTCFSALDDMSRYGHTALTLSSKTKGPLAKLYGKLGENMMKMNEHHLRIVPLRRMAKSLSHLSLLHLSKHTIAALRWGAETPPT